MISNIDPEEDAPPSPANSAAEKPQMTENPVAVSPERTLPNKHPRDSLSSLVDMYAEQSGDADQRAASSASNSVQLVAEEKTTTSDKGCVEDVAEERISDSQRQAVEDIAEKADSPSEHSLIGNTANQHSTEMPVDYESTAVDPPIESTAQSECIDQSIVENVTDVPLDEKTPAGSPVKPMTPVMDRISVPSHSVPYYATPKIMIHEPSQSSEAENSNSNSTTSDEVLANKRQTLPQETESQPLHSAPDGNPVAPAPMQSMSLRPITWQAPKDQKIQKRKLYLRKVRNAAARKTILKATLGRQLAIPTKQMLRLLACGESMPVPNLSHQGVETSTMLVPQGAEWAVTGAVLLPQDVAGAVSED